MGVEREHIVLYGIVIYNDGSKLSEKLSDMTSADINVDLRSLRNDCDFRTKPCLTLLRDPYLDEYFYLGIIISVNGRDRFQEARDLNDFITRSDMMDLDRQFLSKCFDKNIDLLSVADKIGLYVFTHRT